MGAKESTTGSVVAAATSLFLERGIVAVSMGDIAGAAGCTRRTLYRHFAAKEDLVYEVVIKLLEAWNAEQEKAFAKTEGDGLSRLGAFLNSLAGKLGRKKPLLKLLGEFDFVFRDELGYKPDRMTAARFASAAGLTERLMEEMIVQGLADGSVRTDADPAVIVPVISAVLWGSAQRVAIRGKMMREEFGIAGERIIREQIDLYLRALSARKEK